MKEKKEKNLFLEGILQEKRKNLRYMLILACNTEKVVSIKNRNENCDFLLHDLEKIDKDVFVRLYDSNTDDSNVLKSAIEFISSSQLSVRGNLTWLPAL